MTRIPAQTVQPADEATRPVARVLITDDEESMRHFLDRALARAGYAPVAAAGGEEAISLQGAAPCDVAVVDLKMPGMDGLEVLATLRERDPSLPVILMTAHGSVASAVEAMRLGAFDYVTKPFEIDELVLRIERAREHKRTLHENQRLRQLVGEQEFLVGKSAAMQAIRRTIELLRSSLGTVLITGESGTGKGLLAREIHRLSDRAAKPFVALHCAALPDSLLESELFGHEPGAFTGATKKKTGLVMKADGGMLFLDEVAEISLAAQAKLERLLQERELVTLGGEQPVHVDVRFIAATNRDLEARVREGTFRQPLFWRLNVLHVHVPPLRERADDVPLLVRHYVEQVARRESLPPTEVDDEAMAALSRHPWPGNVRELQNVIEQLIVFNPAKRVFGIEDLPDDVRGKGAEPAHTGPGLGHAQALAEFERGYLLDLLERAGGNVNEAARQAGLSRGQLHRRIKSLGISAERFRDG